jgi:uncharacterized protein
LNFDLLHGIAGLLVGAIVGVTGVGGGALMTPILVLLFGVAPTTAVGTDLLYASITKIAAVWRHYLDKHIVWRLVLALAMGSIPAALTLLVILALVQLDTTSLAHWIRLGLGLVLPTSALAIVLHPVAMRGRGDDGNLPSRARTIATVLLGALLGFTSR